MVPMIFSQNGGSYTVPAGKYAVVNFTLDNAVASVNGYRIGSNLGGASPGINGVVLPAGSTLTITTGVNAFGMATGFLYDLA